MFGRGRRGLVHYCTVWNVCGCFTLMSTRLQMALGNDRFSFWVSGDGSITEAWLRIRPVHHDDGVLMVNILASRYDEVSCVCSHWHGPSPSRGPVWLGPAEWSPPTKVTSRSTIYWIVDQHSRSYRLGGHVI